MRSQNTFRGLCAEFKNSPEFLAYQPRTRDLWGRELDFACRTRLGDLHLSELKPSRIKGYLDGWSDKPWKQRVALTVFRRLKNWARLLDLVDSDFTEGITIKVPDTGHLPWTKDQVDFAISVAPDALSRAIMLGAHTGQRRSDLIKMRWNDIKTIQGRGGIEVIQKKTDRRLWVPIDIELGAAMATWERTPGTILKAPWDEPWTEIQLSYAWRRERNKYPELRGLVLHGLRGHRCVQLLKAGLTTYQVSKMVGMEEEMVCRYCRFAVEEDSNLASIIQLEGHRVNKAGGNGTETTKKIS